MVNLKLKDVQVMRTAWTIKRLECNCSISILNAAAFNQTSTKVYLKMAYKIMKAEGNFKSVLNR